MPRNYRYGGNYRDNLLASLMFEQMYPEGASRTKTIGGVETKVPNDPVYQQKGDIRGAQTQASWGETDALAYALGSERAQGEGDREGTYSLAYYPQLNAATNWAATGNMPFSGGGSGQAWLREQQNPGLRDENETKRKQWAAYQKALLGMGGMR
jgi:hypothetical protein